MVEEFVEFDKMVFETYLRNHVNNCAECQDRVRKLGPAPKALAAPDSLSNVKGG